MGTLEIAVSTSVDDWLDQAIASIDTRLGDGYAEAHPALIGSYLQACSSTLHATFVGENVALAIAGLRGALNDISQAIASHE